MVTSPVSMVTSLFSRLLQSLRLQMNCPTSLLVVGGGDDLVSGWQNGKFPELLCAALYMH